MKVLMPALQNVLKIFPANPSMILKSIAHIVHRPSVNSSRTLSLLNFAQAFGGKEQDGVSNGTEHFKLQVGANSRSFEDVSTSVILLSVQGYGAGDREVEEKCFDMSAEAHFVALFLAMSRETDGLTCQVCPIYKCNSQRDFFYLHLPFSFFLANFCGVSSALKSPKCEMRLMIGLAKKREQN